MALFAVFAGACGGALCAQLTGAHRELPGEFGYSLTGEAGADHVSLVIRQGRHSALTLAGGWTAPSWSRSR